MRLSALVIALFGLVLSAGGCATASGDTNQEKRSTIWNMKNETLATLYQQQPSAKAEIQRAPGYAVFSNVGVGLLILGSGQGYGVAVDNRTGNPTYMKMAQGSVGLGVGLKDFRAVFVFQDAAVFRRFVEKGWDFGGEAEAGAKSGDKGGQLGTAGSLTNGIRVYQLTDAGVVLRAAVPLTKYYWYDELN